MDVTHVLEFAKKKKRGQMNPTNIIIAIGLGLMATVIVLFTATKLSTALNNANTTTVVNNLQAMAVNFSEQLGTVGTLAGIGLLVAVVFGGGLLAYRAIGGGKGGTGM